jgi:RND superfamily putative drug exporter
MTSALARLGRFAARRPWTVIGSWVAVALIVLGSSAAFGQELDDRFEAPGVDSHAATELLQQAGSGEVGLGADVVVTPGPGVAGPLGSPALQADLATVQDTVAALPKVLGTTLTTEGEVALIRVQYPEQKELGPEDLAHLKAALRSSRDRRASARWSGWWSPSSSCSSRSGPWWRWGCRSGPP